MDIIRTFNSDYSRFNQTVTLDNVSYKLYFNWNTRALAWDLRFNDVNDNVLVASIRLVLNYELIVRFRDRGLPPGMLFVIDPTEKLATIGRYDLGNIVNLVYVPEAEIATI